MKKSLLLMLVLVVGALGASTWYIGAEGFEKFFNEDDPDMPMGSKMDKEEYLKLRNEHLDMLRGFDTAKQDSREKSVREMERSEAALAARRAAGDAPAAASWKPLGPAPIPVGGGNSGRTSAIAVHLQIRTSSMSAGQGRPLRTLDGALPGRR